MVREGGREGEGSSRGGGGGGEEERRSGEGAPVRKGRRW